MTTGIAKITKTFIGGTTQDISIVTAFSGQTVFAETKDIDFGQPNFNKSLHALTLGITQRGNINDVSFYVGGRQRHEDAITWYGPYSLSGGDTQIWFHIPKHRYFRFKIIDALPKKQWKLNRIEAYGKVYNDQAGQGPKSRT
jgi:hypothetical protein